MVYINFKKIISTIKLKIEMSFTLIAPLGSCQSTRHQYDHIIFISKYYV